MNTFLSSAQETQVAEYQQFAGEMLANQAADLECGKACRKEFMQQVAAKGYLGLTVPRELGGQGLPFLNACLLLEAFGQYEPGLSLTLGNHFAVIEVLKRHGSETQKSRYLPLLARGELLATLAFSEPQAGTDFTAVTTTAVPAGSAFELTGKKSWIVKAKAASLWLTLAKVGDKLTLFFVDGSDANVSITPPHSMMGLRSATIADAELKQVKVAAESEINGDAGAIAAFALNAARVVLAAGACGLLASCLKLSVEHARSREQFGVNIGQFQAIQWKLADMVTDTTGPRLQVLRAAWSIENDQQAFATNAAMCKWMATRAARHHAGEAVQILGASGLCDNLPLERFYRDAKAMEICLGTSEAQKVQLVEQMQI